MPEQSQTPQVIRQVMIIKTLRVLVYAGIPAILGYLIGQVLDDTLGIAPYATVGSLVIAFGVSSYLVVRSARNLQKAVDQYQENTSKDIN